LSAIIGETWKNNEIENAVLLVRVEDPKSSRLIGG
jgi:hypothetical protein